MNDEAAPASLIETKRDSPTASLVLSSGGARGYAHIGAIEELVAQGFAIRSIAGSSMGALIGGVYAAGKLDPYSKWARRLQRFDVLRLLDWTFSGGGFIKGDRLIGVLRKLIGDINIEDLPIPYTAVAVDLDAQREVWFSRGPLFDAIRASIAIPTMLRPYRYQGRLLVDGGLLNPLPIAPTLRDLTDVTIAVDVNAPAEPSHAWLRHSSAKANEDRGTAGQASPEMLPATGKPTGPNAGNYPQRVAGFFSAMVGQRERRAVAREPGAIELFARSLDVVQETVTRLKMAAQPPDILITIPRNICAMYEFYRAAEIIEIGRQRTREALARNSWSC
ncbi:MAG: patatin-like phospholipase family protein [Dokdonella sp.]